MDEEVDEFEEDFSEFCCKTSPGNESSDETSHPTLTYSTYLFIDSFWDISHLYDIPTRFPDNSNTNHKCPNCNFCCCSMIILLLHERQNHNNYKTKSAELPKIRHRPKNKTKWYHCDRCDYKGTSLRHAAKLKINWFHCEHCDYSSNAVLKLKFHVVRLHPKVVDRTRWYLCEQCGYRTESEVNLRRHLRVEHGQMSMRRLFVKMCPLVPQR